MSPVLMVKFQICLMGKSRQIHLNRDAIWQKHDSVDNDDMIVL